MMVSGSHSSYMEAVELPDDERSLADGVIVVDGDSRVQPGGLGYERLATVVCCDCEDSALEWYASLQVAEERFKLAGWQRCTGGWICPECIGMCDKDEELA